MDPILKPSNARFAPFPVKYPQLWKLYKQALASFWVPEEVNLHKDLQQFRNLTSPEKRFLLRVLSFFANADGIVNENLAQNFATEVQIPEARYFYGFQIMIENVHAEVYAVIIDTYVEDVTEKDALFHGMETLPSVTMKTQWAQKWIDKARPFAERLVAFAVVEGLLFSGSFAAIFWFRKRGLLLGLGYANELISRDEGLHTTFACVLYRHLENRLSEETIRQIVVEAVEAERIFMEDAIPEPMLGMNAMKMVQYVHFVADRILEMFEVEPFYKVDNPFDFMDLISLEGKSNFFERRVSEYAKANVNVAATTTAGKSDFTTSEDF